MAASMAAPRRVLIYRDTSSDALDTCCDKMKMSAFTDVLSSKIYQGEIHTTGAWLFQTALPR